MLDETTTDTTPGNEIAASAAPEAGAAAPVAEEAAQPARAPRKRAPRKTAAKKAAATASDEQAPTPDAAAATASSDGPAAEPAGEGPAAEVPAHHPPAPTKKATRTRRSTAKKAVTAADAASPSSSEPGAAAEPNAEGIAPAQAVSAPGLAALPASGDAAAAATGASPTTPLFQPPEARADAPASPAKRAPRKRTAKKATPPPTEAPGDATADVPAADAGAAVVAAPTEPLPLAPTDDAALTDAAVPVDVAVEEDEEAQPDAVTAADGTGATEVPDEAQLAIDAEPDDPSESAPEDTESEDTEAEDTESEDTDRDGGSRRRRRRGGRRRRKGGDGESAAEGEQPDTETTSEDAAVVVPPDEASEDGDKAEGGGSSRRRRRRRRSGDGDGSTTGDDPENTVTKVRSSRSAEDEITGFTGSTRLEAKKQRRREGREAGRRRAPIISEAEFLARRESVERTMVIRQRGDLTQIAVLEDKVLVEHYVARESQTSLMGNVYLGRVQNVLPSMEAAFVDIGKGRNAVLYAGEVNWESFGAKDGQRKIEQVLKPGQTVLVQVSKDPVGHKGARLTSQVSLPGRFLVYVPDGTTSGISRKLPENERNRLKTLLKEIVPDGAGVIVRTAAEGASEEELTRDVERLTARWEEISAKVSSGQAPQLLYGEPDLTLKVVRDLFTEDFSKLVISGDDAWNLVEGYVGHVAPDLMQRMERHDDSGGDAFSDLRIDEQIAKALDRKVYLPSGGSLVIDRTEAMTVVDVNTGKFTGSGGNLEETVTKNNLEAAEEIVRQLRLRDIGGIIVVDFIDMVMESNRDLVLRRLVECLGRDRTRHQVAEVTSLGLVQMTRKRIGTGLLEAFSEPCDACQGRGVHVQLEPVEDKRRPADEDSGRSGRSTRSRRGKGEDRKDESSTRGADADGTPTPHKRPTPADFAAMARAEVATAAAEAVEAAATQSDEAPVTVDGAVLDDTEFTAEPVTEEAPVIDVAPPVEVAAEEPVDHPVDQPADDVEASAQEVQAQPEPPAPPAAPRLVTSVRRRGARRPAGPPASSTASDPVMTQPATGDQRTGGQDARESNGDGVDPLSDGSADGAVPSDGPDGGTDGSTADAGFDPVGGRP